MKKVLIALITLIIFNEAVVAQTVTAANKKADHKMKAMLPLKATAPPKVIPMPKSISTTPVAEKTKPAMVNTPDVLNKDSTPDKSYYKTSDQTVPAKKVSHPTSDLQKIKKGKY